MDDPIAPTLDGFQSMAEAAFESLPQAFRDNCAGVVVRVADYAEPEVLREMGIEDPFELTGLYEGVALTEKSSADSGALPDQVWLYRRPILDEWAERADVGIFEMVIHVLVHEIGHHFGLSDDDIEAIERRTSDHDRRNSR